MTRRVIPHRLTLAFTTLLVASLVSVSLQVRDPSGTSALARAALAVISPFQRLVLGAAGGVSSLWDGYVALVGVRGENQRLHDEVAALRNEASLLREQLVRAGRLEEFLAFQREAGLAGVSARVTGESADPWQKAVMLDRGGSSGVRRGMPVVTPRGVVGRVTAVSGGSAVAGLLVDRGSAIPVLVGASRSRAILEGENSGTCAIKYLDRTAEVKVGDAVVTSGLGQAFPAGLPVGRVTQVLKQSYGLYQYAKVVPAVPLERLEEVLVLTGGPWGTAGDALPAGGER
jgi:rod shape-determining protein MreC